MTARSMRIKVNVVDLIARIEQVRDSADAEYAKALAKYERDNDRFQAKVHVATVAATSSYEGANVAYEVGSGYHNGRYHLHVVLSLTCSPPPRPIKPNPIQANQDIALLRLCADDTISISTDDRYARYL